VTNHVSAQLFEPQAQPVSPVHDKQDADNKGGPSACARLQTQQTTALDFHSKYQPGHVPRKHNQDKQVQQACQRAVVQREYPIAPGHGKKRTGKTAERTGISCKPEKGALLQRHKIASTEMSQQQ